MDKQEYLNQISAKNRPTKKSGNKIFSSKFFWVGVIGVVALILIIIVGSMLGGGKTSTKDKLFSLILHIDNTSEIIEEYQANIKSSDLRSISASLNSVLSNTSKDLNNYAAEKYNSKEKNTSEKITEEETVAKDDLYNELFEAKINGILDRIYARKMAYEISIIVAREEQILKASDDDMLKEHLNDSLNSLNILYDKFDNFSEAN